MGAGAALLCRGSVAAEYQFDWVRPLSAEVPLVVTFAQGVRLLLPIRSPRMTRRGASAASSKCFTSIRWSSRATCSRVPRCLARKKAIRIEILKFGCSTMLSRERRAWVRRKFAPNIPTPTFPAMSESCKSGLCSSAATMSGAPSRSTRFFISSRTIHPAGLRTQFRR